MLPVRNVGVHDYRDARLVDLSCGCLENTFDGLIESGIELLLTLVNREPLEKRPREARHYAMVSILVVQ